MKNLLLFLFLVVISAPTLAAEKPLKATYGIYAGGMHVVDIEGVYTFSNNRYGMDMDLTTTGLLGKLAPWSGMITSSGHYNTAKALPLSHQFDSTWRGETETTRFTFNDKGVLVGYKRDEGNGKIDTDMPPADVYGGGATDMLTALMNVMMHADAQTCETTVPATDGKRRFDMVFRSQGKDTIKGNRYSAYEGVAEICDVEIVPVAGKWREEPRGWMSIQGQAKDNGELPRIWFAKVRDDMPPVPVRFEIKTSFGAMVMHMTGLTGQQ